MSLGRTQFGPKQRIISAVAQLSEPHPATYNWIPANFDFMPSNSPFIHIGIFSSIFGFFFPIL